MPIAALAVLLLATACVVVPVPVPIGAERWLLSVDHARLATDELALACRQDGTLVATAPGFVPVASNEEFALGTERDAFLLVADVAAPAGRGVTASGAIPPALLDDLAAGGALSALYGTQSVGPLSPPAGLIARFVAACRAVL
jgi:hypothetical protein